MIEQIGGARDLRQRDDRLGALRAWHEPVLRRHWHQPRHRQRVRSPGMVRKIARNLQANHGKPVNSVLVSGNYGTDAPWPRLHTVYCHTDMGTGHPRPARFCAGREVRFSGKPTPNEIGGCERFRFITSPDLPSIRQDAGAAVGSTGLQSTSGSNIDVYQFIVGEGRLVADRGARQGVAGPDLPRPGPEVQERPAGPARLRRHHLVEGGHAAGEPGLDGRRQRGHPHPELMSEGRGDPVPFQPRNSPCSAPSPNGWPV